MDGTVTEFMFMGADICPSSLSNSSARWWSVTSSFSITLFISLFTDLIWTFCLFATSLDSVPALIYPIYLSHSETLNHCTMNNTHQMDENNKFKVSIIENETQGIYNSMTSA